MLVETPEQPGQNKMKNYLILGAIVAAGLVAGVAVAGYMAAKNAPAATT